MEIVREGENIDAIVQMVLLEQGWTSEEITFEVLQQPKKSWFKHQPAIVSVKRKSVQPTTDEQNWHTAACAEWIFFTANKLNVLPAFPVDTVVIHPDDMNRLMIGTRPLLMPESMTNGQPPISLRQLTFEEQVEIVMTPDDQVVTIRMKIDGGYQLQPTAVLRKGNLHVHFRAVRSPHEDWNVQCVKQLLAVHGVIWGIKEERINYWLENPNRWDQPFMVAEGRLMQPGRSTEFVQKVKPKLTRPVDVAHSDKDKLNHYGFSDLMTVKEGERLLEIKPIVPGVPGMTVKGNEIPATEGQVLSLQLGEHTQMSTDGNYVESMIEGIMEYEFPTISVKPMYVVNGDVDLKTGSIQFKGSILINGNVREGMTVVATDHVQISGTVTDATIYAGKSIEVQGNVVMSRLFAGITFANLLQRFYWTRQMNDQLIQMTGEGNKKSKVFMDQRFGFVQKWLSETQTIWFNGTKVPWEDRNTRWYQVAASACTGQTVGHTTEEWMLQEGCELEQLLLEQIGGCSSIRIFNSHLSTIFCAGDLLIVGKGSYLSTICVTKRILVTEGDGFIRGGNAVAGEGILAKILGSPAGAHTSCVVTKPGGIMEIGHLNPGVETTIGKTCRMNQDRLMNCKVSYQPSTNRLEMHSK